jgi:hypothetical protein
MFWAVRLAAMLNPSPEQEQAWQAQRIAALEARRQALREVLRLRDLEARRRFLAAYREQWGLYAAESLADSVRAEWDKRRADYV